MTGIMKKGLIGLILCSLIVVSSCTRASKHCKADSKKAKKNNIGWKY